MFEFLFKYPASVFQKGTFVWIAGWPAWLLITTIAGAIGGLAFLLLRHRNQGVIKGYRAVTIWALQSTLIALLLLLLWQPGLSVSALKEQQNIVAVVVDDSKSMSTSEDGSTRRTRPPAFSTTKASSRNCASVSRCASIKPAPVSLESKKRTT